MTTAPQTPSLDAAENLGVLVIAPARYVPHSSFVTFAKGRGEGAMKGAAVIGGPAAAASAVAVAAAAGTIAYPVAIIVGIALAVSSTVVGAIEGAVAAVPAETAEEIDRAIDRAVAGLDAQNRLAAEVASLVGAEPWFRLYPSSAAGPTEVQASPDYSTLRSSGIDTVLEIAVTDIGFETCRSEVVRRLSSGCKEDSDKPMVDFFMAARARLVRVADGTMLFGREFHYKSARREIPRWVVDNGRPIAGEIDAAFRELGERVRDEVLLVAPIDLPAPSASMKIPGPENPDYGICWLAPLRPKADPLLISEIATLLFNRKDTCPASGIHFSTVDSLRPNLRWSVFPRDMDRQALDPSVLGKISDVTYDLRIWQEEGCERGALVHERSGLPTPDHVVERPLLPATRYFWSARARFLLDGRPMVTRWAHFDATNCRPNDIADWQYHRFVTPQ